jgi:hypothetical protein
LKLDKASTAKPPRAIQSRGDSIWSLRKTRA